MVWLADFWFLPYLNDWITLRSLLDHRDLALLEVYGQTKHSSIESISSPRAVRRSPFSFLDPYVLP